MNTRILTASVCGGAALFLLGFVMYDLILGTYMKAQMVQYPGLFNESPNFVTLIIANIVWAILVTLIFDRWATISTFLGGLIGGAMITFFMGLYFDLMNVTFMHLFNSFTPVVIDVIAFTIIGALAGAVIGAVLGMMTESKPART